MMIASATSSMNCECSGRVDERIDQRCVAAGSPKPKKARGDGEHMRKNGSSPSHGEQHDGRVHRDRHDFAVREVDDAHHAEDHRQPERHQPVDQAGQHAGQDELAMIVSAFKRCAPLRRRLAEGLG